MNLVNRTTCLYCELDGVETPLVMADRWCCPVHSREYLDRYTMHIRNALIPFDLLLDKGRPWRDGKPS